MQILKKSVMLFAIAVLLELTVFNFRTYESFFYKPCQYTYVADSKGITVYNIDDTVKNVYVKLNAVSKNGGDVKKSVVAVRLSVTDEGNSNEYVLPERQIVSGIEKSSYINLNLSGNCKGIRIDFDDCDNYEVSLKAFGLNQKRPIDFNYIRVAIVCAVGALILIYKNAETLRRYTVNEMSIIKFIIIVLFLLFNIVFVVWLSNQNAIFSYKDVGHHNQYKQLAEAFTKGQLYLEDEAPEFLKTMDNPYDYQARKQYEQSYQWDTAYYNGHYYVYFGVVPVLMLYLPFYAITGKHITNNLAVTLFLVLTIIALVWLIYNLIKKYYGKVSMLLYLALCQISIIAVGCWYVAKRTDFYIVPIIAGIMFSILGLALWIQSVKKEHIIIPCMVLGSFCMALVAGCRPQLVLASVLGVVIFWGEWKKKKEVFLFFLPYIVVALGIMWYNDARFGSPFDFGAAYNLTISDMTHRGLSFDRVGMGLYAYLIQPLTINVRFPYINRQYLNTYYQGVTNMENPYAGVFEAYAILIFGILVFKAKHCFNNKKAWLIGMLSFLTGIIIVLADTQMGGIYMRYTTDFLWLFMLSSIMVILAFNDYLQDNFHYDIYRSMVSVCMAVTVMVQLLAIFTDTDSSMQTGNPLLFYRVLHMVEFWL